MRPDDADVSRPKDGPDWKMVIADAVDFRHELHQHPELTWQEDETAARIRAKLDAA